MNKEPRTIAIGDPAYAQRPGTEREKTQRLLDTLRPGDELQQVLELLEVGTTVRSQVLRLQRQSPDSQSLNQALGHAEKLLTALYHREAALTLDTLPF